MLQDLSDIPLPRTLEIAHHTAPASMASSFLCSPMSRTLSHTVEFPLLYPPSFHILHQTALLLAVLARALSSSLLRFLVKTSPAGKPSAHKELICRSLHILKPPHRLDEFF